MDSFPNFVECLRFRAEHDAMAVAFRFLSSFDDEERPITEEVTYVELDRQARAIAASLQAQGIGQGQRVVLLFAPGISYVAAFLGCLYAGVIAVPAYPPDVARLKRALPRLLAIVDDAQASAVLTTSQIAKLMGMMPQVNDALGGLSWLAIDELPASIEQIWQQPALATDDIAFLQYTSGSTGTPKGVMLTHDNLRHNSQLIAGAFELHRQSVGVIWLPPYHDMGLIGGILQPLFTGFPSVLMSPLAFLKRPLRWLRAISQWGGTCSGGPNFAFDLCVRKVTEKERESLDLSSWDLAFCGAEPIRPETMERFYQTFAPCGFRRQALYPCYGLAEATLIVSGGAKPVEPVVRDFRKTSLETGRVEPTVKTSAQSDDETNGEARALVSCGNHLPNHDVIIVASDSDSDSGRRCAPGEVGELWVSGPSVAAGYWGRDDESAAVFSARIADVPGRTFLRTGDLAFIDDGELFIAGRSKDLVIIRGRNLYPQDIESTVERCHSAVRPGCSAVFSVAQGGGDGDFDGDEELVVAVEVTSPAGAATDADRTAHFDDIAAHIRRAVADEHEAQVASIVLLRRGAIPKTSSGKIQRHACRSSFLEGTLAPLAQIDRQRAAETAAGDITEATAGMASDVAASPTFSSPAVGPIVSADLSTLHSPDEVAIWLRARLAPIMRMSADDVAIDEPLIHYGLDSLMSIEIHNELAQHFGLSIDISTLLSSTSLRNLGERYLAAQSAAQLAPLPTAAEAEAVVNTATHPVAGALSPGQEGLWFQQSLAPQSTLYNIMRAVRLPSDLDVEALRRSFQGLIDRHGALRTSFHQDPDGSPRRHVAATAVVDFRLLDGRQWSQRDFDAWFAEEAARPFDLSTAPLFRVALCDQGPQGHVLVVCFHHIIIDFWSLALLTSELAALYAAERRGTAADLPAAGDFSDYVAWQQQRLSADAESSWTHWRETLAGPLPALDLPTDHARPPVQTFRGGQVGTLLGHDVGAAVSRLAKESGTTPYITLLAALAALLRRYSAQDDLIVGSPMADRGRPGLENVVGYLINPLPLRVRFAEENRFSDLLSQVRTTVLGAMQHARIPFASMVKQLQSQRDSSRAPLFQVLFSLQQAPMGDHGFAELALSREGGIAKLGELELESMAVPLVSTEHDLCFIVAETSRGLAVTLDYNTDLFSEDTARRMLAHYRVLIESLIEAPDCAIERVDIRTEHEKQLLASWNANTAEVPVRCINEMFAAQVAKTPDDVALVFAEQTLTYAELAERVYALAGRLRKLGIGANVPVGVCLDRSIDMVVGIWGVIMAGGAYVPMDPDLPPERLQFMLKDMRAGAIVSRSDLTHRMPDIETPIMLVDDEADPEAAFSGDSGSQPDDLICMLYTSGSTGRPKGVMIRHRNVANHFATVARSLDGEETGVWLAVLNYIFDVSLVELLWPLTRGFRVVIYPEPHRAQSTIGEEIKRNQVTHLLCTPSRMIMMLEEAGTEAAIGRLKALCLAGEALTPALTRRLRTLLRGRFVNAYGPTEATIWLTTHQIDEIEEPVPIGRPVANNEIYIVDGYGQPQPIGIPGELWTGGASMTTGYWGRPTLTAERYPPDHLSGRRGGRLYRTGDLCRYRADGVIEYLGRIDLQVKLRGYRIELGEIESILREHPAVQDCAVVLRNLSHKDQRLIAHVVPRTEPLPAAAELREHLAERLPSYMVPAHFWPMETFPMTPSGKIDRRQLAALGLESLQELDGLNGINGSGGTAGQQPMVAPETANEALLADIWAELLGVREVGVTDNFFELGGHSLLAAQVRSRIHSALQVSLSMRTIFEAQTVRQLARAVEAASADAGPSVALIGPKAGERPTHIPLSFAQERLWLFQQLEPDSCVYNMPSRVHIRGPLDVGALRRSLRALVERHEVLRTTFASVDERPVQHIRAAGAFALPVTDLCAHTADEQQDMLKQIATDEAQRPFDIGKDVPLRAQLVRIDDDQHWLYLSIHHIAADGWSISVLFNELSHLYRAFCQTPHHASAPESPKSDALPELPIQYADFSLWERAWLDGPTLEREIEYWKRQLAGLPQLDLPTDRPRPAKQTFRGQRSYFSLPAPVAQGIAATGRQHDASVFMVHIAIFQILLAHYSRQTDIVIGTDAANRERLELEGLIGFFTNQVVLRCDLGGDPSFGEMLERVRQVVLDAFDHQHTPFGYLVQRLKPKRDSSRQPLFQVKFVMQNAALPPLRMPGLELAVSEVENHTAKFDILLELAPEGDGYRARFEYSTDLFDSATIARMWKHYLSIAEAVIATPDISMAELQPWDSSEANTSVHALLPEPSHLQHADDREAARTLFQDSLAEPLPVLDLPTDRICPPVRRFRGAQVHAFLGAEIGHKLSTLATTAHTTQAVTLAAALAALVRRYSGQDDILIGWQLANGDRSGGAATVDGGGAHLLPLRLRFAEYTGFTELLTQARTLVQGALDGAQTDVAALMDQGQNDSDHTPIFQVCLAIAPQRQGGSDGADDGDYFHGADYDLGFAIRETDGKENDQGLALILDYNAELYEQATAQRMLAHFRILIEAVLAQPERAVELIDVRTEEEMGLLASWNTTAANVPVRCIHEMFATQAAKTPDAVALVFDDETITYGQLARRVRALAARLRPLGVGANVLVGVYLDRSLDMMVALLGVLEAGGAYLPMDHELPPERLAFMLADTQPAAIVSRSGMIDELPATDIAQILVEEVSEEVSADNSNPTAEIGLGRRPDPDDLACVLYTSGSTGQPKGVMVKHGNLANHFSTLAERAGGQGVWLAVSNYAFDLSLVELLWTLTQGFRVVIYPETRRAQRTISEEIVRNQITHILCTPSRAALFLQDPGAEEAIGRLETLILGGEMLSPSLARSLRDLLPDRFVSIYGPTETTIWSTTHTVDDVEDPVPIGHAIVNTEIFIVGAQGQPQPIGVPGELWTAGANVTRGYWGRPALTADRYVPDHLSGHPGRRLYRTGDLCRYRVDGVLECLGRIDLQVKIRGHRVELGEIEARLRAHEAVQDCAVILRNLGHNDQRLVAHFVANSEPAPDHDTLREHLAQRLPDYMLPALFIAMDALPMTPSGKLDRRRLAAMEIEFAEPVRAPMALPTPSQTLIAQIWSDILGRDDIGAEDNFFDLGGHSLLATQVRTRIEDTLSVALPLRTIFEAQTLQELAHELDAARADGDSDAVSKPMAGERPDLIPLSYAQERLWLFHQLIADSCIYNMSSQIDIRGPLQVEALRRSLLALVDRHEVLRTTFATVDEQPVQRIHPIDDFNLPVIDLGDVSPRERQAAVAEIAEGEASRPFNLTEDRLLRAQLVRLSDEWHCLCLSMHHIAADGWSIGILLDDLGQLYRSYCRDEEPALPPLPVQYADFSLWERDWLDGPAMDAEIAYWEQQLADLPRLQLRTDRPRPAVQSFRGWTRYFDLPAPVAVRLAALGSDEKATPFMVHLAIFQVLMQRYTRQTDIVVGTDAANRERFELERLIGFFTNQVVLRTDLSGNPRFRDLITRVRQVVLDAFEHQHTPFGHLVHRLRPDRDTSGQPLFQVKFVMQNAPLPPLELPDLTLSVAEIEDGTAKFDLLVELAPEGDGYRTKIEYNTDLFDHETIVRLWEHYLAIATAVADAPELRLGEIPLTSSMERFQLMRWSGKQSAYPREATIADLFAEQAAKRPDAIAVEMGQVQMSYGELYRRSNQLAHYLRNFGAGPEVRIGLCLERSIERIIAVLAIIQAGSSYVPLDPSYPTERLSMMIGDAGLAVIVTDSERADELPAQWIHLLCMDEEEHTIGQQPTTPPSSGACADDEAYVMYTSGSTGTPKGVSVPHRAVVRLVCGTDFAHFDADETVLQLSPLSFDASTLEHWAPLLNGGKLVVFPPEPPTLHDLGRIINEHGVSTMWLTASLFHQMVDGNLEGLAPVRQLIAGGDVLSPTHVGRFVETYPGSRVINGYGPTENTTFTCCGPIDAPEQITATVPIGMPIANTRVYILDEALAPCPVGIPGHLYTSGDGLAHGYVKRPALTAERFVPDPFAKQPGGRMYQTGDVCRYLADGRIEFLGREDHQLKVRGYRIEAGEIENALRQHPDVADAVLIGRERGGGDKQLVAYVVPVPDNDYTNDAGVAELQTDDIVEYLGERMPAYMVPGAIMVMDEFPLTPNGKLDRARLPDPAQTYRDSEHIAPRTDTERLLAEVWREVLQLDQVGIDQGFFALGGDSIRAIQVVAQCQSRGVTVAVRDVMEHSTIRRLAEHAEDHGARVANENDSSVSPAAEDLRTVEPFALVSADTRERLMATTPTQSTPSGAVEDAYPLTRLQAGMLFHSQQSRDLPLYHDAFAFHLEMPWNEDALRTALKQLTCRHPVLRTSFDLTHFDEPLQLVHTEAEIALEVADWPPSNAAETDANADADADADAQVAAWLEQERCRAFDWAQPSLLRMSVLRCPDGSLRLGAVFHHAIIDGWSVATMFSELLCDYMAIVNGEEHTVPAPALRFRDFVAAEQRVRADEDQIRFWQHKLEELEVTRPWPDPSGQERTSDERRELQTPIPSALAAALNALAADCGVPLKSVLLAAHLRALSLLSGSVHVVTGVVSNGRPETMGGERVLGLFLNSLPFRQRLAGGTWANLIAEVFATDQAIHPHRRYPMADIQHQVGRRPFDVLFNYTHFHAYDSAIDLDGVKVRGRGLSIEKLDFPLTTTFSVHPVSGQLDLYLQYDPAALSTERAEAALGYYRRILESMVADAHAPYHTADLLAPEERTQLLTQWNADHPSPSSDLTTGRKNGRENARRSVTNSGIDNKIDTRAPASCVHEMFAAQAAKTPDDVALVFDDDELTYAQLADRVQALASRLRTLGVGANVLVGVYLDRSLDLAVALMAVLEAGGAYVPMAPDLPPDRLSFMLADTRPVAVVSRSTMIDKLPDVDTSGGGGLDIAKVLVDGDLDGPIPIRASRAAGTGAQRPTGPDDLACVLYTSGSTGQPKGVMIQHRNLANHFSTLPDSVGGEGVWLAVSNYIFDLSLVELLWTLTQGFRVVIYPEPRRAKRTIADEIVRNRVTHILCTPSRANLFLEDPGAETAIASLKTLILGGEALTPPLARPLRALLGDRFLNIYGPTETTVWSTTHAIESDENPVPVGRPIANTQVYILDQHGQPVPTGVPGELWIGGAGVTRGYWNRPSLTSARFMPDHLSERPGGRLYRTGDLCRYRDDGVIEYLGRIDLQVKIRGHRIELGEIETALRAHPEVHACAVVAAPGHPDPRLVGYLMPHATLSDQPDAADEAHNNIDTLEARVRAALRTQLPEYMIPTAFMCLDALPLTPSGKIDRRALPAVADGGPAPGPDFVAPKGALEQLVSELWQDELHLDAVGRDHNFFDLGGDSLRIMRVHLRLRERLGRDIPIVALFEHPTVATLAQYLATEEAERQSTQERQKRFTKQSRTGRGRLANLRTRIKPNER